MFDKQLIFNQVQRVLDKRCQAISSLARRRISDDQIDEMLIKAECMKPAGWQFKCVDIVADSNDQYEVKLSLLITVKRKAYAVEDF